MSDMCASARGGLTWVSKQNDMTTNVPSVDKRSIAERCQAHGHTQGLLAYRCTVQANKLATMLCAPGLAIHNGAPYLIACKHATAGLRGVQGLCQQCSFQWEVKPMTRTIGAPASCGAHQRARNRHTAPQIPRPKQVHSLTIVEPGPHELVVVRDCSDG